MLHRNTESLTVPKLLLPFLLFATSASGHPAHGLFFQTESGNSTLSETAQTTIFLGPLALLAVGAIILVAAAAYHFDGERS